MKKVVGLAFLTLIGCQSTEVETNNKLQKSYEKDFTLQLEQETQLNDFKLLFEKVAESRCPANAFCIRAGEVIVDLKVNAQQNVQMCLGECQMVRPARANRMITQDSLEVTVDSKKYLFVLKQVNPYPGVSTKETENPKVEAVMHVKQL